MFVQPYTSYHNRPMLYQRFNSSEIDTYAPGQVEEYVAAAEAHYTYRLPYHNWDHAVSVMEGVDTIADKLDAKGVKIARGTLKIAAAWHDAGYHQNHAALDFSTKEDYSAALLDTYLEDKPVTHIQKQLMRSAIVATWHLHPEHRTPPEMILHRADTANIGGPADRFVENNVLLWREARTKGHPVPWSDNLRATDRFVRLLAAEHDHESLLQNIDPEDTTVDVNDQPFAATAKRNLDILYGMSEPR